MKTHTLQVKEVAGKSRSEQIAEAVLNGPLSSALLAVEYNAFVGNEMTLQDAASVLNDTASRVRNGELADAETMLSQQAIALNAVFAGCAMRAKQNMGTYPATAERYLRLALKAQSQCRATWETIAAIKNPTLIYARQANITSGPQQVNNGLPACAWETESLKSKLSTGNELLENDGAPSAAVGKSATLETVGNVYGSTDG